MWLTRVPQRDAQPHRQKANQRQPGLTGKAIGQARVLRGQPGEQLFHTPDMDDEHYRKNEHRSNHQQCLKHVGPGHGTKTPGNGIPHDDPGPAQNPGRVTPVEGARQRVCWCCFNLETALDRFMLLLTY